MKKFLISFFVNFLFCTQIFAIEIFMEDIPESLLVGENFTFEVEILHNEDITSGELVFIGIENFYIISQSSHISIARLGGTNSYSLSQRLIVSPRYEGIFQIRPEFVFSQEVFAGPTKEIKILPSSSNVSEKNSTYLAKNSQNWGIIFLGFGVILFVFFVYYLIPRKKYFSQKKTHTSFENNEKKIQIDENSSFEEMIEYFLTYIEKKYHIKKNKSQTWEEYQKSIFGTISDTQQKNTIKNIIFDIQSSQYSSYNIDKKNIFDRLLELKKTNNI